ncbi:MAG: peptidase, partial [Gemmatimonadetes bacterium]|nr:peptidase [Gemmatimonadota bacterium]
MRFVPRWAGFVPPRLVSCVARGEIPKCQNPPARDVVPNSPFPEEPGAPHPPPPQDDPISKRSLAFRAPKPGLAALAALLAALPSVLAAQAPARPADPAILAIEARVRAAFSGQRALAATAFVERYWRLPGNAGFDASIQHVAALLDSAGYVRQDRARAGERLTYRIERHDLPRPAWEPRGGSLRIVGQDTALLDFATNRNLLAVNSFATPNGGVTAQVVDAGRGTPAELDAAGVRGKVALVEGDPGRAFAEAVQKRGAAGVLAYAMPAYTHPEQHPRSIQFRFLPYDDQAKGWAVMLSYAARQELRRALAAGPVQVNVRADAGFRSAPELTVVAEVRGSERPAERFVYSAHVQEPGANDNASGVGALAEAARVAAALVRGGAVSPRRTLTFVWGDEIGAVERYLKEDAARAAGIRWGLSLDMVGEDTERTGGTFLIEKMPDPSAVWTRGEDHHTEWGGEPLTEAEMRPHYYNDFVLNRCLDQAAATGWTVRTNPFEGGSDHTPFLDARKAGVLFWHFTDVYYHTDGDRIGMVSPRELANVGVCALSAGLALASANGATARFVAGETERAAAARLDAEAALG